MAKTYRIVLSPAAQQAYDNIVSAKAFAMVERRLTSLKTMPRQGSYYDPLYEAARTTLPIRVTYTSNYGIYYRVIEDQACVEVSYIEDQRRDPNNRFQEL